MDEVVELLSNILSELRDMNEKIDELIEYHSQDCERNDVLDVLKEISYNTENDSVIADIHDVVTEIQDNTRNNDKIEEVCSKLDDIKYSIDSLDQILWYHISNDISFSNQLEIIYYGIV